MDGMSATQKVLDENLKARIKKANDGLIASLDDESCCGASHSAVVEGQLVLMELDQLNHAGIQDMKLEVGNVTGEIQTLTTAVTNSNGHALLMKKGPLKGMPVKYVLAASLFLMAMATGVILFAIAHGKLSELAEGINIVRGRPVAGAVETPGEPTAGAVARVEP